MKTFPKHQQAPPLLTALIAAQMCMAQRGHVVIGFPPDSRTSVWKGSTLRNFAGSRIEGHCLVVIRRTSREDWDQQARLLFGDDGPRIHPKERGQRFYACELIAEAQR